MLLSAYIVGFSVSMFVLMHRWRGPDPLTFPSESEWTRALIASWLRECFKAVAWPLYLARPW